MTGPEYYKIYNSSGQHVGSGFVANNDLIDLSSLAKGLYFLQVAQGSVLKVVKW